MSVHCSPLIHFVINYETQFNTYLPFCHILAIIGSGGTLDPGYYQITKHPLTCRPKSSPDLRPNAISTCNIEAILCGFGVRIVPLYPPACRKRRLKGGVHGSLVVTFAAAINATVRGSTQGRNLDRDF